MIFPARGRKSPSRTPSARRMADPEAALPSFGVLKYAVDGHDPGSSEIDPQPWLDRYALCARTT